MPATSPGRGVQAPDRGSFAEQHTGKPPSALSLADLDAPLVLDFLDHLETERGNTPRTRNARLAEDIARYIELRYNRTRLHSALGYRTPQEVHDEYLNRQRAA